MPKLTRKYVATIEKPVKPTLHWDSDLTGFAIMVQPSGRMTWVIQYRVDGKERRAKIGPVDESMTPEQARAAATKLLARVRLGEDPAAERKAGRKAETVAELAERWLAEHVKLKRKGSTLGYYDALLKTHILPPVGTKRAVQVTRADMAALHRQIASKRHAAARPGAKRAPASRVTGGPTIANRALKTVSAMYGWAEQEGLLPQGHVSPTRGIELFAEQGKERFLSPQEMERLGAALAQAETVGLEWQPDAGKPAERLKHVPKSRREVFPSAVTNAIRLLILTGCRLREILHLRWAEVDFQRGLLRLGDSKTGRKVIILGGPALTVLRQLEAGRLGAFVVQSTTAGTKDEAPRRDLQRPWRAICRAARLEGLRLHDLRHSFASVGAGDGLGLQVIGKLLGHADIGTTARYSHLSQTAERRAAEHISTSIAAAIGLQGADVISLEDRRRA